MDKTIKNNITQKPLFSGQFFTSGTIVESSLVSRKPQNAPIQFYDF